MVCVRSIGMCRVWVKNFAYLRIQLPGNKVLDILKQIAGNLQSIQTIAVRGGHNAFAEARVYCLPNEQIRCVAPKAPMFSTALLLWRIRLASSRFWYRYRKLERPHCVLRPKLDWKMCTLPSSTEMIGKTTLSNPRRSREKNENSSAHTHTHTQKLYAAYSVADV